MIVKHFELKKKIEDRINCYLLYGENSGLIEETINTIFKPIFSQNIFNYDENDILLKLNDFEEEIYNKSFFENDKLIIINRASDKILNIIENIVDSRTNDLKIIIKTGPLEKKSKLRGFFEKNKDTIIVPFYEDNYQSLMFIAQNFFKEKKIKISSQNINFIIERAKGNRINLRNELTKIFNYSKNKLSIEFDELLKLTNLAENYDLSELVDHCLAKNQKKTLNILNENNLSTEDNIIIVKTFLYKLKRLKKLKEELEMKKNIEVVIDAYKPPIFWKDKPIIKQQLKVWSLDQLISLFKKINNIEIDIKKNSQISSLLISNFILEKVNSSNSLI
tara:strand:+ start:1013 stop:2014 length:1002 start_codon:yes stop_codon:yes gene_type:complete